MSNPWHSRVYFTKPINLRTPILNVCQKWQGIQWMPICFKSWTFTYINSLNNCKNYLQLSVCIIFAKVNNTETGYSAEKNVRGNFWAVPKHRYWVFRSLDSWSWSTKAYIYPIALSDLSSLSSALWEQHVINCTFPCNALFQFSVKRSLDFQNTKSFWSVQPIQFWWPTLAGRHGNASDQGTLHYLATTSKQLVYYYSIDYHSKTNRTIMTFQMPNTEMPNECRIKKNNPEFI